MSSWAVGITGYCLLIAVLIVLAIAGHQRGGSIAAGSGLVASIRRSRTGRILLVLAWAWLGWHLFVR